MTRLHFPAFSGSTRDVKFLLQPIELALDPSALPTHQTFIHLCIPLLHTHGRLPATFIVTRGIFYIELWL